MLKNDMSRNFVSEEQLQENNQELGATVSGRLRGKDPLVICILKVYFLC